MASYHVQQNVNRDEDRWAELQMDRGTGLGTLDAPQNATIKSLRDKYRQGNLTEVERRILFLNLICMLPPNTLEFKRFEVRYNRIRKDVIENCPGCELLHTSHLPTFGAHYLPRFLDHFHAEHPTVDADAHQGYAGQGLSPEEIWDRNLFQKHCLSEVGVKAAKRVLLALDHEFPVDFCPILPDLVCMLLVDLSEVEAYAVACVILERSRHNTAWESSMNNPNTKHTTFTGTELKDASGRHEYYFPTTYTELHVFTRTFMDLAKEKIPLAYWHLVGRGQELRPELERVMIDWFSRLFIPVVPLRAVQAILDCFIVEGAKVLYRFGLALLKMMHKNVTCHLAHPAVLHLTAGIHNYTFLSSASRSSEVLNRSVHYPICEVTDVTAPPTASQISKPSVPQFQPSKIVSPRSATAATYPGSSLGVLAPTTSRPANAFVGTTRNNLGGTPSDVAQTTGAVSVDAQGTSTAIAQTSGTTSVDAQVTSTGVAQTTGTTSDVTQTSDTNADKSTSDTDVDRHSSLGESATEVTMNPSVHANMKSIAAEDARMGDAKTNGVQEAATKTRLEPGHSDRNNTGSLSVSHDVQQVHNVKSTEFDLHNTVPQGTIADVPTIRLPDDDVPVSAVFSSDDKRVAESGRTSSTTSLIVLARRTVSASAISTSKSIRKSWLFGRKSRKQNSNGKNGSSSSSSADLTSLFYKRTKSASDVLVDEDEGTVTNQSPRFTFKELSAIAFRNFKLRRESFAKIDVEHRATIDRDYSLVLKPAIARPHFPKAAIEGSHTVHNYAMATRLVSWLPAKVRSNSKALRLQYSTEIHGRSLDALYYACSAADVGPCILVIKAVDPLHFSRQKQNPQSSEDDDTIIFGGYSSEPLQPQREHHYIGDGSCFLFRLSPEVDSKIWRFTTTPARSGATTAPLQRRPHAKSFASTGSDDGHSAMFAAKGILSGQWSPKARRNRTFSQSTSSPSLGYGSPNIAKHAMPGLTLDGQQLLPENVPLEDGEHEAAAQNAAVLNDTNCKARAIDANRLKFVYPRKDQVVFGSAETVEMDADGQVIPRTVDDSDSGSESEGDLSDVSDALDDEDAAIKRSMGAKHKHLIGPGLRIDKDLLRGHSGWCTTYRNEPLCLHCSEAPQVLNQDEETKVHMKHFYFEIAALEVFTIPRLLTS